MMRVDQSRLCVRLWSKRSEVQISGGSNRTLCCQRLAIAATFIYSYVVQAQGYGDGFRKLVIRFLWPTINSEHRWRVIDLILICFEMDRNCKCRNKKFRLYSIVTSAYNSFFMPVSLTLFL